MLNLPFCHPLTPHHHASSRMITRPLLRYVTLDTDNSWSWKIKQRYAPLYAKRYGPWKAPLPLPLKIKNFWPPHRATPHRLPLKIKIFWRPPNFCNSSDLWFLSISILLCRFLQIICQKPFWGSWKSCTHRIKTI